MIHTEIHPLRGHDIMGMPCPHPLARTSATARLPIGDWATADQQQQQREGGRPRTARVADNHLLHGAQRHECVD